MPLLPAVRRLKTLQMEFNKRDPFHMMRLNDDEGAFLLVPSIECAMLVYIEFRSTTASLSLTALHPRDLTLIHARRPVLDGRFLVPEAELEAKFVDPLTLILRHGIYVSLFRFHSNQFMDARWKCVKIDGLRFVEFDRWSGILYCGAHDQTVCVYSLDTRGDLDAVQVCFAEEQLKRCHTSLPLPAPDSLEFRTVTDNKLIFVTREAQAGQGFRFKWRAVDLSSAIYYDEGESGEGSGGIPDEDPAFRRNRQNTYGYTTFGSFVIAAKVSHAWIVDVRSWVATKYDVSGIFKRTWHIETYLLPKAPTVTVSPDGTIIIAARLLFFSTRRTDMVPLQSPAGCLLGGTPPRLEDLTRTTVLRMLPMAERDEWQPIPISDFVKILRGKVMGE